MERSVVRHTGLEPVTSALSRQRSKPTELMPHLKNNEIVKLRKFQSTLNFHQVIQNKYRNIVIGLYF